MTFKVILRATVGGIRSRDAVRVRVRRKVWVTGMDRGMGGTS